MSAMRRLLIGGNWKSNGSMQFARDFPTQVLNNLAFDASRVEVVVCPTTLHLSAVQSFLQHPNVNVGCQNVSLTGNGAFTGEVTSAMVKDMGFNWCLTGHSERRTIYGENDD